jgi:hypothetical protein
VTIIDTITADGTYLNPGLVFKGKDLQAQWFLKQFRDLAPWHYISSPNGWTDNAIAVEWLKDVFLPQMNKKRNNDNGRAILLILDGHKSHTSVGLLAFYVAEVPDADLNIGGFHGGVLL